MKKLAYLFLLLMILGITACNAEEKSAEQSTIMPEVTTATDEIVVEDITNETEIPTQGNNQNEVESLNQNNTEIIEENPKATTNTILLTANGYTLNATLVENSSTAYLIEQLLQGDIVISMSDYGSFEKVGSFGFSLPTNDEQVTAAAGELILYQGNSLVILYGTNSWNYTRLGKINDVSTAKLSEILGAGNVTVTLSLAK